MAESSSWVTGRNQSEKLLTVFQHRTQSHQAKVLVAMLKKKEEEENPLGQ